MQKKGQTIAGITFTKNGQYHNRKIDLILNGEKGLYKGDIRSGQCGADIINGRLKLTIATEKDSHIDEGLETFIHEIIIHAEQYSKDFIDNGKLDNSQVYPELKKFGMKHDYGPAEYQHWQELNVDDNMGKYGIPILQNYYKQKGINKTRSQIRQMMRFIP